MVRHGRRAAAVVLGTLIALEATAVAQDARFRAEAERRNRTGSQLYGQGRFEEALRLYQAAYDLYPEPRFQFNIGLAREKLFDYEGCALAFQRFLGEAREADEAARKQAEERRSGCRERALIPVRFTSAPTNAAIYLGEGASRNLKGRTPHELKLPPGAFAVTMELEGYVPHSESITVEPGARPQVDFVLEKLSSLRIEADPGGARIKIDDGDWEAAPAQREVQAGAHLVQVVKQGYEDARREVKVEPGQEVSLVLSLRPLPQIRKLDLRTDARARPGDLHIRIDGKAAQAPPMTVELSAGGHRLEARAPGHLPFAGDITVPPDRDLKLLLHLEPVRSRRQKLALYGLAGAAGAAAATAGTFGVLALVDQQGHDERPSPAVSDRGESRAELADVFAGTAVVLAGAATLYWLLTTPDASTATVEY